MRSFLRRTCTFALIVAIGLVPVAPARAADPYNLDVVISLSGQAGLLGQVEQKVLGAIEDSVNRTGGIRGRPLHFVYRDDQSNAALTVQLVNQILAGKPAVMLGPTLGATSQAVLPLMKDGPVTITLAPIVYPPKGSFMFSSSPATSTFSLAFARYAKERGWKRIAMITTTDQSGQDPDDRFMQMVSLPENKEMTMVAHERFGVQDLSVAAQMTRIKAADPQVIIAIAAGAPNGTLMRGIHDAGLDIPVFGSPATAIAGFLQQLAPVLPKELLIPGGPALVGMVRSPKERAVQQRAYAILKAIGMPLDTLSFAAIDPAFILVDALRALGPNASADQVRVYIENLHDYWGIYGIYDFRDGSQRGLGSDGIIIERWDPEKTAFVALSSFGGKPLR